MTDRFNFTWGATLNDLGFVQVYNFMLRHYAALGVTRPEMLLIIHLASYCYNSAAGESRPSLSTIAAEMGHSRRASVSDLVRSLEEKGFLKIDRHLGPNGEPSGRPSTYDATPFSEACLARWQETRTENRTPHTIDTEVYGKPYGGCTENRTRRRQ